MGATTLEPLSLLQARERELTELRDAALRQLETQLASKEQELQDITSKFNQLRADFEYNLQLLEDRDAELAQYDSNAALQAAAAADKDRQLSEMQAALQHALSELKSKRAARKEEEFLASTQRMALQKALEDERAAGAEALLRAREQHEQARRSLQRSLTEAEESLARQQREMAAGFSLQVQQLELKYRQQAEDAQQEAEVAKALAQQREEEARAAHARELEQLKATEAALADARRHEHTSKALSWELDNMRKLRDDSLSELTQQNSMLKHQLKMLKEDSDSTRVDLTQRLAAATASLEQLQSTSYAAAQLAAARHEEEVSLLRQKLEQAQAHVSELRGECADLRGSLQRAQQSLAERTAALEQATRAAQDAVDACVSELEHKHGAELRQLREGLMSRDEEVRVLREKLDNMRRTLDERRADLTAYKEQVVAAGERERELQRKLMVAELRLEELSEGHTAAADQERLLRSLMEQRDTANAALQDAQLRLIGKEAALATLQEQMQRLSPRQRSSALQAAATAGMAAVAAAQVGAPQLLLPQHAQHQEQQNVQQQNAQGGVARTTSGGVEQGGGSRLGARSRLSRLRPAQLAMPGQMVMPPGGASTSPTGVHQQQGEDPSALASPTELHNFGIPSPRSSGSFWAGVLAGDVHGPPTGGSSSPHALHRAIAARAAEFLRSSQEQYNALVRSTESDIVDAHTPPPNNQDEVAHWRSAAERLQVQNASQLSMLADLRAELEAIQQQAAAAAANKLAAPPSGAAQDVQLLQAELQESDHELQEALRHVQVLQEASTNGALHIQGLNAPATPSSAGGILADPGGAHVGPPSELSFLREKVRSLTLENRQLRREALGLRLQAVSNSNAADTSAMGNNQDASTRAGVQDFKPGDGAPEASQQPGALPSTPAPGTTSKAVTAAGAAASEPRAAESSSQQAAEEVEQLKQTAARLRAENDALMEMSNALRCERDRIAAWLHSGAGSSGALDGGAGNPMVVTQVLGPGTGSSPPVPLMSPYGAPVPVQGPFPAAPQSLAPIVLYPPSHSAPAPGAGPQHAPPAFQSAPGSLQQGPGSPSAAQAAASFSGPLPNPSMASSLLVDAALLQQRAAILEQQAALDLRGAAHNVKQLAVAAGSGGDSGVQRGGGSSQEGQSGGVPFQGFSSSASGAQPQQGKLTAEPSSSPLMGSPQAGAAGGQQGGPMFGQPQGAANTHRPRSPSRVQQQQGRVQGQGQMQGTSLSGQPQGGPAAHQQQQAHPHHDTVTVTVVGTAHTELSGGWAGSSGGGGQQSARDNRDRANPAAVPGSATNRETPSQRAKLRALQRRHEHLSQPAGLVVEGSNRPRVRNYNVRDDGEWQDAVVQGGTAGISGMAVTAVQVQRHQAQQQQQLPEAAGLEQ